MKTCYALELLESRIAPAVLLPGGKGITYTDVDGDLVTVTFSKGAVSSGDFTFNTAFGDSGPQQLQLINLSDDGQEFAGANVTVSAKAVNGKGNSFANVGFLSAKGVDLGVVKIAGDLGRIEAGNESETVLGVKSLTVQSMGSLGTSTQAAGGTLRSFVYGGIVSLKIAGDFDQAEFNSVKVGATTLAGIGSVTIGGSVIGGSKTFSGQIYAAGKIGPVKIGGDLRGGSMASTGQISAGSSIASVFIGGDLIGGGYNSFVASADSGAIISGREPGESGNIGSIIIAGSIIGGVGDQSGRIIVGLQSPGKLNALTVGDDVAGGAGMKSGSLVSGSLVGMIKIGGSLRGGDGALSAEIFTPALGSVTIVGHVIGGPGAGSARLTTGPITKMVIGGSVLGGLGQNSGGLFLGVTGSLTIGGSVESGDGVGSGQVSLAQVGTLLVKGSLLGGGGADHFAVQVGGKAGSITIGGDLRARDGYLGGLRVGERVEKLLIKGSILAAGGMARTDALLLGTAGRVQVLGNVVGDADSPAQIRLLGAAATPLALAAFTVGGRFEHADLLVGNGVLDGVQLGSITIGKDFIASRLAVSTEAGVDGVYGTMDDLFQNDPGLIGRIASVTIKGLAMGTPGGVDAYRIIAEQIGKITVHGVAVARPSLLVPLGSTGDLALRTA